MTCVLGDLQGALALLDVDGPTRDRVVSRSLAYLSESFAQAQVPSTLITGVHRILKQETGIEVPFAELRAACNRAGAAVAERVREETAGLELEARFHSLVRWAIAGNHLDFRTVGAGYGFEEDEIYRMLRETHDRGLHVDDCARIWQCLQTAGEVVYIPDNVGELAFDLLLIELLREQGKRVVLPLRGGAITSDATLEDGEWFGARDKVDEVIRAGPDTLGISWEEADTALHDALGRADFVIAKGQANYYVMTEHAHKLPGGSACLLTSKCRLVSSRFGSDDRLNIATLLRDGANRG